MTWPAFRGKRLFLAIDIPDYIKDRLQSLQEDLRGFHWVSRPRYHLTLKFIGDVPGQFQDEIEQVISKIEVHSFLLPVKGIGTFPSQGSPHAVWAGLSHGHPRLFQLHKRIEDGLFGIGIEPERRIYHPHLTLARVNQAAPETVRQFIKRHNEFETAPFRAEQFHLYRSEEIDGHRSFTLEKSWQLL